MFDGQTDESFLLSLMRHSAGACEEMIDSRSGRPFRVCEPSPLWNSEIIEESSSWLKASINLQHRDGGDFKCL
uniref:Uncharacterized protein n=1 Tax=Mesocestoides corti TaxID=53468 RepID=A0A5K3EYG9_MESCO